MTNLETLVKDFRQLKRGKKPALEKTKSKFFQEMLIEQPLKAQMEK